MPHRQWRSGRGEQGNSSWTLSIKRVKMLCTFFNQLIFIYMKVWESVPVYTYNTRSYQICLCWSTVVWLPQCLGVIFAANVGEPDTSNISCVTFFRASLVNFRDIFTSKTNKLLKTTDDRYMQNTMTQLPSAPGSESLSRHGVGFDHGTPGRTNKRRVAISKTSTGWQETASNWQSLHASTPASHVQSPAISSHPEVLADFTSR